MFSAKIVGDVSEMVEKLDLKNRLESRTVLAPQAYDDMCQLREHAHLKKNFKPTGSVETIQKGTYYLTEVDDMFRRQYAIKE
jgi:hydroxymethylglutaryl-CoA synthase